MWLEVEQQNLLRVKAGVYSFRMPDPYETNSMKIGGWAIQGIGHAPRALLAQSIDHVKELLSWLPDQLRRNGDLLGAVLGAMLLRHFGDDHPQPLLQNDINKAVGRESYFFAGVDELKNVIEQQIGKRPSG